VCDLETSRMGAPYIYDISRLRVKVQDFFYKVLSLLNTEELNFFFPPSVSSQTRRKIK